MRELDFSKNFEDYNDTFKILGVRIPEVKISESYIKKYGLLPSDDEHEVLRKLCLYGYKNKNIDSLKNKKEYIDRVKFELDTLKRLGFTRYILMVFDLIEWCDENKIARGWGRGSVAGSLVAYLIGMTAVDPVKYGLIFERFINEARAKSQIINGEQYSDGGSVPDIDFDVCYVNRGRVVHEYLGAKYPNRTAHISTLNTLSTKLALKEVCKKYGGFQEYDAGKISNMVESDAGTLDSLDQTIEKSEQFKEWVEKNPDIYKICKKIVDLPKNFGLHAAGIIVSYNEIFESLPLELRDGNLTSCYTKDDVAEEEIKLDALGLKQISVIYNVADEVGFDLNSFDVNDPSSYKLLQDFEHTYGIFQLDGGTASRVTRKVRPKNLSDVSAISAIARPGALAFLEDFVEARETGKIKSIYPPIDEILKETGGVILYQEQTMKIAHEVYGFSLVDADILRKIIGKKQLEKVKEWEDKIKRAGDKKGIPESATQLFWETVQASAKYQFNASHSYSYSYISALCSYLKLNYPASFFKNSLMLARTFQNSEERIMQICKELPHFGVELKPPDLIKSSDDFTVDGNTIRYGLQSIKSVSSKSLEKLKQFNSDQPNKFKLFESAKESGIPISILKNLIRAGCLSSFGENRGRLVLEACTWNLLTDSQKSKIIKFGPKYNYDILEILVAMKDGKLKDGEKEIISTKKRKTKNGESSPWDNFYDKYTPFKEEYEDYQKQFKFFDYYYEQDVLGFSYSDSLKSILADKYDNVISVNQIENEETDSIVVFGGIVQEAKIGKTKKGGKMLSLTMSDETGLVNVKMFNYVTKDGEINNVDELEKENGRLPEKGDVVVVRGNKKDRVVFSDKIKILNLSYKK